MPFLLHLQFIQLIHPAEKLKYLTGLIFIDARERKAHVDQDVLAGHSVCDVFKADALGYAAEVHFAHEHIVLAVGFGDSTGNAQAHVGNPF